MANTDSQVADGLFNIKEGLLAKTGSNNRGWKDRFFRLKDGKLNYYKSEKDSTLLGYIDLRDCIKVTRGQGKKGYGFDIHVPGRVYNLSTRSEDEVDEWTSAVEVSVAVAKSVFGDRRSGSILERTRLRSDSFGSVDQDPRYSIASLTSVDMSYQKSEPDSHVNSLLEAEVKALNTKSSQLEVDLKTTQSHRDQLIQRMQEMKTEYEEMIKQYKEEISLLKNQIQSLEKAKLNLGAINDSLRVQVQEREESMINLEQQLTDEIRELEEELKTLQDETEKLKERHLELNEHNESTDKLNFELKERISKMKEDFKSERETLLTEHEELKKELESEKEKNINLTLRNQKAEEQVKASAELCHKLELTERERDRLKVLLSSCLQNQQSDMTSTMEELKAERLQLQVELENLRNSIASNMEAVKCEYEKEKEALVEQINVLVKDRDTMADDVKSKATELASASSIINEMKGRIESIENSNNLLQIEKDKAMADLRAMKKNMKEKSVRKCTSDEETTSSPSPDISAGDGIAATLSKDAKLVEAENRAELATRLLKEIQVERDELKAQMRKQGSSKPIVPSISDGRHTQEITPVLDRLKSKAHPTTAVSTSQDLPPPKPKLPNKDILDRLLL